MRRFVLSVAAAASFLACAAPALALDCPAHTYAWHDNWGNPTCREMGTNKDVVAGSNPATGCPTGTYAWHDGWGNKVCKSQTGNATYYDTSKGCPVGTHAWHDGWGRPTCER